MRRDRTLQILLTIRRDLQTQQGGVQGDLEEAIHGAVSKIADLQASIERSRHYWLYDIAEPIARFFKVILQMAIGVTAVVLIWRLVFLVPHDHEKNNLPDISATLTVIAAALAIAAAVELAYTLFTPGPDEAIDPLMLGLAAALSLQLSEAHQLKPDQGWAALAYAAALGLLFAIRAHFVKDDVQPPTIHERLSQACKSLCGKD